MEDSTFPTADELRGVVQGTLLYLSVYMCLLAFQSFSKFYLFAQKKKDARAKGGNEKIPFRAVKYYNGKDMLALAGDRTVGNYVEFAIIFLPLLWMHAIFVDPSQAFTICFIYALSRLMYPFLFLFGGGFMIVLSTIPGYVIYTYLFFQICTKFAFV
mmetsp:Transcript_8578/g.10277  ORF Transcript_8578/g.10277 Transcript_8578/m.10277 type:complete len:157 (-) Transcript_8578:90-560(-)